MIPDPNHIHELVMEQLVWKMSWIPGDTRWLPNESHGQRSYFKWLVEGKVKIHDD